MFPLGLWIGIYLLILAVIVNAIMQKWRKKSRSRMDRRGKGKTLRLY